jgi:hypothetical protein
MKRFEVLIELSDGMMAVALKTDECGEANSYKTQLETSGKYKRNLIKITDRDASVPKPRND